MDLIRKKGVKCAIFICDLSDEKTTVSLISQVYKEFPDLNILVNNASIFYPSGLSTADLKSLDQNWAVNFRAPFILTCELARLARKGLVINLLDTNIVRNKTSHFGYLLSKKMLFEFTKMAAVELGPYIRVNGICPGLILAPSGKEHKYLERRAEKLPLKKVGNISNITKSVQFLIENDFLTGEVIFNDGGEQLI